jgi:hypothetical protein
MDNNYLSKTFFPGSRKQLRVQGIQLLTDKAGVNRIKLALVMSLADNKLVGVPSWIAEAYEHMAEEESQEVSSKFAVDLDEITMYIHTTEDIDRHALVAFSVKLKSFKLTKEKTDEDDEEVPDLALCFEAYLPDNRAAWHFLYDYGKKFIFVRFDTTQPDLKASDKPKPDTQMKLGDEGYESARKNATSKVHDAEFAGKAN